MKQEVETLSINGVEYVKKEAISEIANKKDGMKYVIIRTYSAGVHAGYLECMEPLVSGTKVILRDARRIYYWSGAATLSQLAMDGTSDPDNCKFPCAVDKIELTEAIEVIYCTEKARKSIEGVKIWRE